MSDQLTLSLVQMDIRLGEPDANLERGHEFVRESAARGADLVIFPELWTTGYDLARATELADPAPDGRAQRAIKGWAMAYKVWITGSFLLREREGVSNAGFLFGPEGEMLGPYAKIHRFGLMDEDKWLNAGEKPGLFDLPWGKTGLAICYDLRFPELFRGYALAGARLILLPSEWPHPRLAHWRTLIRARAIENQCFFAAVNRVGRDRDNHFCGHSALIDPWGETVVEAGQSEILLTATVDLAQADEVRQRIPVLSDRRPECYILDADAFS